MTTPAVEDSATQPANTPFAKLHVQWMVLWVVIGPFGIVLVTRTSFATARTVFYAVITLWIALQWRKFRDHSFNPLALGSGTAVQRGALLGLCMAPAVGALHVIYLLLTHAIPPLRSFQSAQASASQWTIAWIIIVIVAPIVEELLFRGIILNRWRFLFGPRTGFWLTAVLFALFHGRSFFLVLPLAVLLGHLYLRSGDLWSAIAAHAVNNAIATAWTEWGWPVAVGYLGSTSMVRSVAWCLVPLGFGMTGLIATLRSLGAAASNNVILAAEAAD